MQVAAQGSGDKYDNVGECIESNDFDTLYKQIVKGPIHAYYIGEYMRVFKQILELAKSWRNGATLEKLELDSYDVEQDGSTFTLQLAVGFAYVIACMNLSTANENCIFGLCCNNKLGSLHGSAHQKSLFKYLSHHPAQTFLNAKCPLYLIQYRKSVSQ